MAMTALGANLEGALETSFAAVRAVQFEGMYYRKDIGTDLIKTKAGTRQSAPQDAK